MEREIKFRAWDKAHSVMSEVAMIHFGIGVVETYEPDMELDLKDVELMQFTGLTDKAGKEIYEGDIVKVHVFMEELGENLGVVEGEKEFVVLITIKASGVMLNDEPLALYFYEDFHDMSEPFEIIGNIHQHPHLLEGEKI